MIIICKILMAHVNSMWNEFLTYAGKKRHIMKAQILEVLHHVQSRPLTFAMEKELDL